MGRMQVQALSVSRLLHGDRSTDAGTSFFSDLVDEAVGNGKRIVPSEANLI
jgi:hypothetical protein